LLSELAKGQRWRAPAHIASDRPMVFTPSEGHLAVIVAGGVQLLDARHGREARFLGAHFELEAIAVSPDGRVLAGASQHGLRFWDIATGTVLGDHYGHRGSLTGVAFSPDGTVLATTAADTTILLWDVARLIRP
jgi:WD40 repeat protein